MKQSKKKLKTVKVVMFGMGVIGRRLANHLITKKGIEIVGALDINPNIVGKDLGDVLKREKIGVIISNEVDNVLSTTKPDIVCHTTTSFLQQTYNQFIQILEHGVNCISTCEELSYPYVTMEDITFATNLDEIAKRNGVTLLGTGINPGFLMDTLPIVLTGVCLKIDSIYVTRQMDAATRRIPFQKKIGAGLTIEEFNKKIESHVISGHVGLKQSIKMISDSLGWNLDEIRVAPVDPVILDHDVESNEIKVPKGYNAGSMQKAYGIKNKKAIITLDFRAFIGASEEYDSVDIKGIPPIKQKISPCIHGDYGTIAIMANMIPIVMNAQPGLKTMKDLPIPHATPTHMGVYTLMTG